MPYDMTPSRARGVLIDGARYHNWSRYVTPEEDAIVREVWHKLNGEASWYTALCVLAIDDYPPTDQGIDIHSHWEACGMLGREVIEQGGRIYTNVKGVRFGVIRRY